MPLDAHQIVVVAEMLDVVILNQHPHPLHLHAALAKLVFHGCLVSLVDVFQTVAQDLAVAVAVVVKSLKILLKSFQNQNNLFKDYLM